MTATNALRVEKPTILIVDDTAANLDVMAGILGNHGFSVVVAQDGEEGVERAQFAQPDLILLDVMMPGLNGFDVCRRLKTNEHTKDIPVIFMTALSDQADKISGFNAGCVDYVTKPFQINEVLMRVNTHLALQATRRQLADQNLQLRQEVVVREQAELALHSASDALERRVAERTADLAQANERLAQANERLKSEIFVRTRTQEELREREMRIRRLIESNIIGIFFWDVGGSVREANDAFLRIIGYKREEMLAGNVHWVKMTPAEYGTADERALAELGKTGTCTPYEKEFVRKDGRRVPVLVGGAFFDGSQETGVGFVLDLSDRKQAEDRIRYMAHHDALTGLPNRILLQDRMTQAIAHARRGGTQLAVIFVDLDNFKRINDSLGHVIGDRLLQMVAGRLQECLREGDSIARLGGDEFVLTVAIRSDINAAALVARKILDTLAQLFVVDGNELHICGSIGISLYPVDGTDGETLMRAADTAMYHAKEKGRSNFQFFTPELNKAVHQRLVMENSLRQAWAADRFTLHYQPQVDMTSGAIISCEALLRWQRPGGKAPISCAEFIAIAEETGLIVPIGERALRDACKQLRCWHDRGYPDLRIAVNLSPRQFHQENFPDKVAQILEEAGLAASDLDLEITESLLLQRNDDNIATLRQFSAMGVTLSVDDFGTGYSSLAYLQRYPINSLKIDQSFVRGITQNANDPSLVIAIIAMAHSLNLGVLAEGVETPEQASFLMKHNCRCAQGFYYSTAVPAENFTELLDKPGGIMARAC
ncbi:MAG TPA: EAL domain-containing protein [Burkholderiaceae bacterium]|nr:EAL domain-containing protein [Burkholderiaceae bacterium]